MRDQKQVRRSDITAASTDHQPTPDASSRLSSPTLPTGTVTFLFTDIEGSTLLWERHPAAMQRAFARQEAIVREAMGAHDGYVYKMIGDAFQVAFATASDALCAAVAAQRALHAEPWGPIGALRVRMALHTGVTEERGDDYVGPDLNRIGRLLSAGHGGQILLSQATADLVRDHLPEGVVLRDLGEHVLRGLVRPERIYQAVAPGLPADYPPLRTGDVPLLNLPLPSTPFVGREAELDRIAELLRDPACRLISLVGLGGSGKTRLAIQGAAQQADAGDPVTGPRVCFVGLAPVLTLEGMVAAIADALRMSFYVRPGSALSVQEAQDQLLSYLADKEALLVLDNAEHLLADPLVAGPCVDLIAALLAVPDVKLIVTSRERLNLPGEWVIEVGGLSFPAGDGEKEIAQYAAVQLFVGCATRTGPFAAEAADWPAIARICQLLAGMPLGIEMAAAWTKVLSCHEIVEELERDLLALIATWRGVPERHRTLRAVFDHSWRLLADQERQAYAQLAVFQGAFRREAAAEVAGASLPLLGALVDKSLLRRSAGGRFEMQPVLRQCASEKLAADPALSAEARSRHARAYSAWLRRMNEQLKGSAQLQALAELRAETRNLHDAWRWAIEQRDLERLYGMLPALILFHEMRGRPAGVRAVVELLLDTLHSLDYTPGNDPLPAAVRRADPSYKVLLALVLAALRHFGQVFGEQETTRLYQRESIDIAQLVPDDAPADDLAGKAFALLLNCEGAGIMTPEQCVALCHQCIAILERVGDTWGVALGQLILADEVTFGSAIDPEGGRSLYQSALQGFDRLGNAWGCALCLTGLAHLWRQKGRLEEAYRTGSQSLDTYAQMGDAWRVGFIHHMLGEVAEELGRLDDARRHYEGTLAHSAQARDVFLLDHCREHLQRLDERARAAAARAAGDQRAPASLPPGPPSPEPAHSREHADGLVEPLSARELEVLALLAEGLTNREIAQRLCLSPNTVRVHTHNIYGKLGVSTRTRAVAQARARGLLAPS
ncbi:MAG: hypothetical protein JXA09_08245 [Anaerolineae bacterium]|nr:hypothetical protein [Anaerolineae bacterium]